MGGIALGSVPGCATAVLGANGSALAAERVLMRRAGLVARPPDGWCPDRGTLFVDAADAAAFSGDRVELRRLLGGLRAILPLECPQLQGLRIVGRVGGARVAALETGPVTGWQLREAGPPPVAAAAGAAMPAPGSPPRPVPAPPARDLEKDRQAVAEACFRRPKASCVLVFTLAFVHTIMKARLRARTLVTIAEAQAEVGQFESPLATARAVEDRRERASASSAVTAAGAEAEQIEAALVPPARSRTRRTPRRPAP
jgi:hypothetical protein